MEAAFQVHRARPANRRKHRVQLGSGKSVLWPTMFTRSRDSSPRGEDRVCVWGGVGGAGGGGGQWEEGEREEPFSLPLILEQRPGEIPEI